MEYLNSRDEIEKFIFDNELAFLYISSNSCSVCEVLFPKINSMLDKYPKIVLKKVDINNLLEVTGYLSIFTIPAVILYIEGKEVIRKARFISIDELDKEIKRYYNYFN